MKYKHDDILTLTMLCYTVGMAEHKIEIKFPVQDPGYTKMIIDRVRKSISEHYIKWYSGNVCDKDGNKVDMSNWK
jgi:hypothetical protein